MKFETRFNCGDKAWVFGDRRPEEVTIGQIRIQYTNSPGLNDGYVEPNLGIAFDNYTAKDESYEEVYMCVETGVGSGTLWKLGHNIFATEQECARANAANLDRIAHEQAERKAWERRQLLSEEPRLRARLAEIDAAKADAPSA